VPMALLIRCVWLGAPLGALRWCAHTWFEYHWPLYSTLTHILHCSSTQTQFFNANFCIFGIYVKRAIVWTPHTSKIMKIQVRTKGLKVEGLSGNPAG
jgi:hypothetical protein